MRVLVTGASGFTGSYVVPHLVDHGLDVSCFVRKTSDLRYLPTQKVRMVYGDLEEADTLHEALYGSDALVNIASLGFGHASAIVQAASKANIQRAIFFSTTSIFTTLEPESKQIRISAEKTIQESGLAYTILRPTMIYGSSRDRNISRFINFINLSPVFPIFGSGENKLQPVYVKDLAKAVGRCLNEKKTIGKAYNLSGGSVLSLMDLVGLIASELDKKIFQFHVPPWPFILGLRMTEKLKIPFPITSEQIQRFNEDKDFNHTDAENDFGYSPTSFVDGLRAELEDLGLLTTEEKL